MRRYILGFAALMAAWVYFSDTPPDPVEPTGDQMVELSISDVNMNMAMARAKQSFQTFLDNTTDEDGTNIGNTAVKVAFDVGAQGTEIIWVAPFTWDGFDSFEALLNAPDDVRVVIQDPRSSISGLALVLWVNAVYGDEAEAAWARLAPKIVTVTQGWSESYGLFTDGEADVVLSYTTSPAYHIIAEEDLTKTAAIFEEGHYFMVEMAVKLATTDQPELADEFMAFILTEDFQTMIPTTNWSFPAALSEDKWPAGFQDLPMPETVLFYDENEADALRDTAIEAWRSALSQ